MITLGASQYIAGGSTNATTVNCTIMGALTDTTAPPIAQSFKMLYQGQLGSSVASLFACSASQNALVSSLHLFNTGSSIQTVTLSVNGIGTANDIGTIAIPANGWASYEDGRGWSVYTSTGILVTGSVFLSNGLGIPAAATTSLTASTQVVVGGTLITLPNGYLAVGQRYRWHIGLEKTAAGTATWTAKVCFGQSASIADGAMATWTSGTNTAAIDQATLIIEAVVTAIGSGTSFTMACIAFYVNTLTNVTGLGRIDPVPGSTAGSDSTLVGSYLHVDITAGASAVMTSVGMAEQVK